MLHQIISPTCLTHRPEIERACRAQLDRARGDIPLILVSRGAPVDGFGEQNIVVDGPWGGLTMHRQILAGIQASAGEYLWVCDSDVLYHPAHFDFVPPRRDTFYYNINIWRVRHADGLAVRVDCSMNVSCLVAHHELMLDTYTKRVEQIAREGYNHVGEPGNHQTVGGQKVETWSAAWPNICIRHDHNLSQNRWRASAYRNPDSVRGWTEANEVPGWGKTRDNFIEILARLERGEDVLHTGEQA